MNTVELKRVNPHSPMDLALLYQLLDERETYQAISHKEMPSWEEHCNFVRSDPYKAWYLIDAEGEGTVGATYFSKQNEIGIAIFKKHFGNGYATEAIRELQRLHEGPYYANINPENAVSIAFFKRLGFKLLQVTYVQE